MEISSNLKVCGVSAWSILQSQLFADPKFQSSPQLPSLPLLTLQCLLVPQSTDSFGGPTPRRIWLVWSVSVPMFDLFGLSRVCALAACAPDMLDVLCQKYPFLDKPVSLMGAD